MLCQEIGPAQGIEEIPSECLWTWLCKGCNSKSKRWQKVEICWEVWSHLQSSENRRWLKQSQILWQIKFEYYSWIFWSPFPSFQTFSICSLRIFSWLVWPLASALYLSPIDTLAIGSMCNPCGSTRGETNFRNVRSWVDINICQSTSIIVK